MTKKLKVDLWLDDVRLAPLGWIHCKTVDEAKLILREFDVQEMSLDHDLDLCPICHKDIIENEQQFDILPLCKHDLTGYDLVKWCAENNIWSKYKPLVHSANPVGRFAMCQMIDRFWN